MRRLAIAVEWKRDFITAKPPTRKYRRIGGFAMS